MEKNVETITSRSNPVCVHIKKLGSDKSYRHKCGEFLCDGEKLLKEAIDSGAEVITVLTSKVLKFTLSAETQVYNVKNDLIDSLSPLKNPQGVLFTCNISDRSNTDFSTGTFILLDNIQDPGNVGTIIRTAGAFEIPGIIVTKGCADIYNPKTIRASMGAIFKQKIIYMDHDEIINIKQTGLKLLGASNDTSSIDLTDIDLTDSIIIIGNEGQGISNRLLSHCDELIKIPISQKCESLNAATAASIIIWEASRERII